MLETIHVPIDNSEHSDAAVGIAVELAAATGARCIGMHAYAGRMHDYRFKQMEYTLPDEYQEEAELLRQRRIHDSLITTGLHLISESYTDVMRFRCLERGVEFEARARDGRNFEEVLRDIDEAAPDLVVMGALGTGAVRQSQLGSVAERVLRRARHDVLLVRDPASAAHDGPIVVCIDGSPQSFGALRLCLDLGRATGRKVEAIAVYDPYLHYSVFNGIVDVLSEKASKVFRFKEQEALHEEIIDSGLAKIYESHLQVARMTAEAEGMELPITLLDGKVFDRVLRFCDERHPWLVACGRIGVHSDSGMDIGGTTEQLIRLSPCNVLVVSGTHVPPIDVRADASVVWTPEANEAMGAVPAAMRGMARTVVLRWALERGHSVISSGDVTVALDQFMPAGKVMRAVGRTAATLAGAERAMLEEVAPEQARSWCSRCGYAARSESPEVCPVCGAAGSEFEIFDAERAKRAASQEGDATELAPDGRRLGWTVEARRRLQQLPAGYLRRRVKAMVEKQARTRRLPAITLEVAEPFIGPEVAAMDASAGPHRAPLSATAEAAPRLRLEWTEAATVRLDRIPPGFLRSLAAEQIERLAVALGAPEVTELHAEAGIAEARDQIERRRQPVPRPREESAYGAGLNEVTAPVVTGLGKREVAVRTPVS